MKQLIFLLLCLILSSSVVEAVVQKKLPSRAASYSHDENLSFLQAEKARAHQKLHQALLNVVHDNNFHGVEEVSPYRAALVPGTSLLSTKAIANVASMAASLTKMMKQDPAAAKSAMKSIRSLVDHLEEVIVNQHKNTVATVTDVSHFQKCFDRMNTDLGDTEKHYPCPENCCSRYDSICMSCRNCSTPQLYCPQFIETPGCEKYSVSPTACSMELRTLMKSADSCRKGMKGDQGVMTGMCKTYQASNKPAMPYEGYCNKSLNESLPEGLSYGGFLAQRVLQYYELKKLREHCENATAVYHAKAASCNVINAEVKKKQEQCNKAAKNESAVPGVSLQPSNGCLRWRGKVVICNTYDACYATAKSAFKTSESTADYLDDSMKGEWKSLSRIDCLLDIVSQEADASKQEAKLKECQEKASTESVKKLNILVPVIPVKASCDVGYKPAACDVAVPSNGPTASSGATGGTIEV